MDTVINVFRIDHFYGTIDAKKNVIYIKYLTFRFLLLKKKTKYRF